MTYNTYKNINVDFCRKYASMLKDAFICDIAKTAPHPECRFCNFRKETKTVKYIQTIKVSKKDFEAINHYLTVQPKTEEDAQSEDDTIVYSASFPDGKTIDVKCCGVQFEDGGENTSWTEAVLFDKDGHEIACTDVCEEFLGKWELEDGKGNTYIADVVVE